METNKEILIKIAVIDSFLDNYVIGHFDELPNNLLYGKGGLAIYYATHRNENETSQQIYDKLATDLPKGISGDSPLTMDGGVLDTALGAGYIVRTVEKGNADDILDAVDQILYARYGVTQNRIKRSATEYMDALFYMSYHLKYDIRNEVKYGIFAREATHWIEEIYSMADGDSAFYADPVLFNLAHKPVLFFDSLLCLYSQGIYTVRIEHIFNELLYKMNKLPVLHSNRLQLLYIVQKLCLTVRNLKGEWLEYRDILRANTSIEKIQNEEMTKDQIFFSDGLSGVYLIMTLYNKLVGEDYFDIDTGLYVDRVLNSVFTRQIPNKDIPPQALGLNGFWGIRLLLDHLDKENAMKV